jgi:hypothetical protein
MADEMVGTAHPLGKQNKPVRKREYDLFKATILDVLRERELTHTELVEAVTRRLDGAYDGNISWHVMTVKLDLEAKHAITRTGGRPQRYRVDA